MSLNLLADPELLRLTEKRARLLGEVKWTEELIDARRQALIREWRTQQRVKCVDTSRNDNG